MHSELHAGEAFPISETACRIHGFMGVTGFMGCIGLMDFIG